MTASGEALHDLADSTVMDSEAHAVGPVRALFVDDETGRPEWAVVSLGGLLGHRDRLVPLAGAQLAGRVLHVHYTKAQIANAPQVDSGQDVLDPVIHERLTEYWEREPQTGSNVEGTLGMEGEVPAGIGSVPPAERTLPDRADVPGVSGRGRLRRWREASSPGTAQGPG